MSTVLVVEDSQTQREMISELLRRSGLNVIAASDGVEALKQVQGCRPDLVVLDIILPGMNGYEVCRRLKSDEKIQKPAVVMCSKKGERFDFYWALKQGADAYLDKPFRPEELVETVKYLLREQAALYL
jgi:twitching motility two-component system response regulator PilH